MIVNNEEKKCFICEDTRLLECHHIFGGANRKLSEKYGLKVFLCWRHHRGQRGVHFNPVLMDVLHKYGQDKFEKEHPDLDFRAIFGKNYK